MHTIDTLRAEPVLTADRVIAAWVAAGPGTVSYTHLTLPTNREV